MNHRRRTRTWKHVPRAADTSALWKQSNADIPGLSTFYKAEMSQKVTRSLIDKNNGEKEGMRCLYCSPHAPMHCSLGTPLSRPIVNLSSPIVHPLFLAFCSSKRKTARKTVQFTFTYLFISKFVPYYFNAVIQDGFIGLISISIAISTLFYNNTTTGTINISFIGLCLLLNLTTFNSTFYIYNLQSFFSFVNIFF